ncbi:non-ribosomal peptide synthetase [Sorangium sp. So ce1128]
MSVSLDLRCKLLVEFNGRPVPYPRDRTILHLFEAQAAATPDAAAVTFDGLTLTYRQLNGKANALAAQLLALGVRKGDLVPILMGNCLELPLSMIALMKLGAPFIPIDGPRDRIRTIVNEMHPKALLCVQHQEELAGLPSPRRLVEHGRLEERESNHFGTDLTVEDLIYGFYTSGSTGTPKCTLNVHLGLLNRFLYMSRRFKSHGSDVVLQNSRHVFDSSIWQMLWPLTNGSHVVIPDRSGLLDLAQTMAIIEKHRITMTDFVPSIFNAMVELLSSEPSSAGKLASLRQILIGGEEINPKAVWKFLRLLPHGGITNTYGPTEASIGCVFHEVTEADSDSIPIGSPIDNTYVAIVDEELELVPPGTVGEIYIGGDCLGRGYLNDPEKTKAAFVTNPFPEIPSAALYRTGDLGYHREDGLIQFVGRRDSQVKIGGVRIELGEVEAAISSHALVREAKVIVHEDGDGQKMLVAYVVAQRGLDSAQLKEHVARSLQSYSTPKQFIFLDQMPLTPNGKVDRKALVAMFAQRGEAPVRDDGNLSPEERAIKAIWLKLLKSDSIDVSANFFTSGGDSLTALLLGHKIEQHFQVKVPLMHIVSSPTIRELAALVKHGPQRAGLPAAAPLREDLVLPSDISAPSSPGRQVPRNVLLTGATGFIGAQLLHDLLGLRDVRVFCLIRSAGEQEAMSRVQDNLRHYGLWDEPFAPRIVPVVGDLSQPGLGLPPEVLDWLAQTLDTIVHSGALVNLLNDYQAHRAANVAGTVELLRLASCGRLKPIHHISTLSVFPESARARAAGKIPETAEPSEASLPTDGYSQSKWVAERLLSQGRSRGIPVTLYRLGEVMPHSRKGIPNPRGLADMLLQACLELGLSFETSIRLDYTPVDYVSHFIVEVLRSNNARGGCFHVVQPESISFNDILANFPRHGFGLRKVLYSEFWQTLTERITHDPTDKRLASLVALLPEPLGAEDDPEDRRTDQALSALFTDGTRHYSLERTTQTLNDLALRWPPVDARVLGARAEHHLAALH